MKYFELLSENTRLGLELENERPFRVGILSNIVADQLKEILEFTLRSEKINAHCTTGSYDNIIQDAPAFATNDIVAVFRDVANLTGGFQYKAEIWSDEELNDLISKTEDSFLLLFDILAKTPVVLINKFSALPFSNPLLETTRLEMVCDRLNQFLHSNKPDNVVLVNTDKIIARLSVGRSYDFRNFYSSKAPYTVDFFRSWSEMVKPAALALQGKTPKALIFDGDNTLWKGIIGEDSAGDIAISALQPGGAVYEEIHALATAYGKRGVLLGMNSKNNPGDVELFLAEHPESILNWDSFTIRKINWNDKVSNLREIAQSLNIGADSIIFIDDSDFETNFVKEQLPMVRTLQVPGQRSAYPQAFREVLNLFHSTNLTGEDVKRQRMYEDQITREAERTRHKTLEDYLASLSLCITVPEDLKALIPRLAQLTQKTNQFNLTTVRYSEPEISTFVEDPGFIVIPIHVTDRFGDSGITGLAIIRKEKDHAFIDTMLMSCRIIGRNIEFAFADLIMEKLRRDGVRVVHGTFSHSAKNAQVADLFDRLGFSLTGESEQEKRYEVDTEQYKPFNLPYISIGNG